MTGMLALEMQCSTALSEQVRDKWARAAGGADEKLPVFRGHRAGQHRARSYEAREGVVLKGRILDWTGMLHKEGTGAADMNNNDGKRLQTAPEASSGVGKERERWEKERYLKTYRKVRSELRSGQGEYKRRAII